MTALWSAYRALAPLLGALAPVARPFVPAPERALWGERLGRVVHPGGCDAWVHAASLGEATAVHALVPALERAHPGARLHLSATTCTGRKRLERLGHAVSLAPLDFPAATRRFLAGVAPARMILVETELWPHWVLGAAEAGIGVAVVSARMSVRSCRRLARLGRGLGERVAGLAAVLCQSEQDRARWIDLGALPARTEVVGNLKYDALPHPADSRAAARRAVDLDPEAPLLVLGSVRPGEAAALARAWVALPRHLTSGWQVVAVPRHAGARRALEHEAAAATSWRWDARPGALLDYYAGADLAFVGGSLVPIGGHNPLEPAACGAATLIGPHHGKQQDGVDRLLAAGALEVVTPKSLGSSLAALLADGERRRRQAEAALELIAGGRGVAARAVARLADLGFWR